MRRGEVWWAKLPVPYGSGPGYRRPVVIIQSDSFNESRIGTVVTAVITSNVRLRYAPGNVFLERNEHGLSKDSVVNVSQIITLDRSLLTERVTVLPHWTMDAVDSGLQSVIGL